MVGFLVLRYYRGARRFTSGSGPVSGRESVKRVI